MAHPIIRRLISALLGCTIAVMAAAPLPVRAATSAPTGFDVSWPQCGGTLPPSPLDVSVVGVNGGRPFTRNTCLTTEFAWAETGHYAPALYVNVDYPTAARMGHGQTGPAGHCSSGDTLCFAYNYGWNAGQDAVQYARSQGVDAQVWWLDVETTNSWSSDTSANARVVQGEIDAFLALGKTPGTYSTGYQWGVIAGAFTPGVPVWTAGARSAADAPARCSAADSFTGGPVWLVQYPNGSFDGDYGCTAEPGWNRTSPPPAGIALSAVTSPATVSAALAVDNDHIYLRPSTGTSLGDTQVWSTGAFYGTRETLFADLDGPGKPPSAVAINDDSVWVERNNGTGFGSPQSWSSVPFYGSRATLLADVDGSGRASAVAVNDWSVWVMLNQGDHFGPPTLWSTTRFFGARMTVAAVVDASYRASLVAVNDKSMWVLPNLGDSFGAPQEWSSFPFSGSEGTFLADVDGSGRASAIAVNKTSIWVAPNRTTHSFDPPQLWSTETFFGRWNYAADVDGSGRAAVVAVNETGIFVKKSTGSSFAPVTSWLSTPFYGTR